MSTTKRRSSIAGRSGLTRGFGSVIYRYQHTASWSEQLQLRVDRRVVTERVGIQPDIDCFSRGREESKDIHVGGRRRSSQRAADIERYWIGISLRRGAIGLRLGGG